MTCLQTEEKLPVAQVYHCPHAGGKPVPVLPSFPKYSVIPFHLVVQGMQLMHQQDNYHAAGIQQETKKFQLSCWRERVL